MELKVIAFHKAFSEAGQEFLWHAFKIPEWYFKIFPDILILCKFVVKQFKKKLHIFGFSGQ